MRLGSNHASSRADDECAALTAGFDSLDRNNDGLVCFQSGRSRANPVGSLEVGEHQDVEQLGAGGGAEGVETGSESGLELVGTHCRSLRRREASPGRMYGSGDRRHAPMFVAYPWIPSALHSWHDRRADGTPVCLVVARRFQRRRGDRCRRAGRHARLGVPRIIRDRWSRCDRRFVGRIRHRGGGRAHSRRSRVGREAPDLSCWSNCPTDGSGDRRSRLMTVRPRSGMYVLE